MSRVVKMTRLGTREKLEARLAELGLRLPIDDEIEAGGPLSRAFDVGEDPLGIDSRYSLWKVGMRPPTVGRLIS